MATKTFAPVAHTPFTLPEGTVAGYRPHAIGGGDHYEFKFPNGRGASVVRFSTEWGAGSYGSEEGRWELAVLNAAGSLDYSTPVTYDVVGWLDEAEVSETLTAIAALAAEVGS